MEVRPGGARTDRMRCHARAVQGRRATFPNPNPNIALTLTLTLTLTLIITLPLPLTLIVLCKERGPPSSDIPLDIRNFGPGFR